ncbi:unnamed protein product [Closterium sp. Naga37s-1]|nr:unnamed protein product [Closterium sp. Naga37s-1]
MPVPVVAVSTGLWWATGGVRVLSHLDFLIGLPAFAAASLVSLAPIAGLQVPDARGGLAPSTKHPWWPVARGSKCQTPVVACSTGLWCANGGMCVFSEEANATICKCPSTHTGASCQTLVEAQDFGPSEQLRTNFTSPLIIPSNSTLDLLVDERDQYFHTFFALLGALVFVWLVSLCFVYHSRERRRSSRAIAVVGGSSAAAGPSVVLLAAAEAAADDAFGHSAAAAGVAALGTAAGDGAVGTAAGAEAAAASASAAAAAATAVEADSRSLLLSSLSSLIQGVDSSSQMNGSDCERDAESRVMDSLPGGGVGEGDMAEVLLSHAGEESSSGGIMKRTSSSAPQVAAPPLADGQLTQVPLDNQPRIPSPSPLPPLSLPSPTPLPPFSLLSPPLGVLLAQSAPPVAAPPLADGQLTQVPLDNPASQERAAKDQQLHATETSLRSKEEELRRMQEAVEKRVAHQVTRVAQEAKKLEQLRKVRDRGNVGGGRMQEAVEKRVAQQVTRVAQEAKKLEQLRKGPGGEEGKLVWRDYCNPPDSLFRDPPSPFRGPPSPFRGPPSPFCDPPSPFRDPPSPFRGPPSPFRGPPSPFRDPPSPFRDLPSPFRGPPSLTYTSPSSFSRIRSWRQTPPRRRWRMAIPAAPLPTSLPLAFNPPFPPSSPYPNHQELETIEDPTKKEVADLRKRIELVDRELRPMRALVERKEKELKDATTAYNNKNAQKSELVGKLFEIVTESERQRLDKLEEITTLLTQMERKEGGQ